MIEQIYNALARGGIVMIPICIVSLFLWYFIFERLFFFRSQKALLDYKLHSALEDFFKGDSKTLAQFCENSHGRVIETLKNLLLAPLEGEAIRCFPGITHSEPEGTAVRDASKWKAHSEPEGTAVGKVKEEAHSDSEGEAIRYFPGITHSEPEGTAVGKVKEEAHSEPKKGPARMNRSGGLEIEMSFKQIFQQEYPRFYKNLGIISVLISIAPLLGLLGTIYGLLIVFNVITIHGVGDVHQLSGGIAQALITTEAGLIVALPALFIHSRLEDKAENIVREFKKISTQISKQTKNYD